MITAFLIGTLLFLATFMLNIYIIRRFLGSDKVIKLKKEKKKDFVCDGCGKGYIGASRNSFIIRVAGYETYNIQLCNACLLSLKKKINKEENE